MGEEEATTTTTTTTTRDARGPLEAKKTLPLRQRSWAEMQGCGATNAKLKGDGKTQSGLAAIWHGQGLQENGEAQSDLAAISVEWAMEVEGRGGIGKAVWPLYGRRRCCRRRKMRKTIWPLNRWRGDGSGRARRDRQSGLTAIRVEEVLQEKEEAQNGIGGWAMVEEGGIMEAAWKAEGIC